MKCSTLSLAFFLSLLLIILTTSCSSKWHLKKALQKDPTMLVQDTMIVTDTVVTESTAVLDSVIISKVDTIEIVKNNFRVKIMRSFDTLIIDGGCDADTVFRTIEVPYDKIEYIGATKYQKISSYIVSASILLIIVGVVLAYIRKRLL
jgi:hypothetical protein